MNHLVTSTISVPFRIGIPRVCNRHFHLTAVECIQGHGKKRRGSKGEAKNRTRYGPLTDLPDFSYLDGRPTPLTPAQQKRRKQRIELATDIMEQLKQIEFAKERHEKNQIARQLERQSILDNKLKAKS